MQACNKCKIRIITKTNKCPLCGRKIAIDNDAVETYPRYRKLKDKYRKVASIISIIAPTLIIISVVLNLLAFKNNYWSVLFSVCVIYFWLLGLLTFNRKTHLGLKLLAHAVTIPLVLIMMNIFATTSRAVNDITWAISYATPLIILSFMITISFMMIRRKQRFKDYLLYLFALCLMGFIPLGILLFGVAKPLYPSVITALYSYMTIIYLVIFSKRQIKEELDKRFHL